MNKHFYYLIGLCQLLMIALLASCNSGNKQDNGVKTFKVDVDQRSQLSDFIDDCRYVKLETNERSIFSEPYQLRVSDDFIGILSKNRVVIFDSNGRFINDIDRRGQGPDEYIELADILFDGDKVLLLSKYPGKIIKCTVDGDVLNTYDLDYGFSHFAKIDDDKLLLTSENSNNSGFNFIIFDKSKNELTQKFDSFDDNESMVFNDFNAVLCRRDSSFFVTHPFDHTVYRLSGDEFTPAMEFKFNTKKQLPEDKNLSYAELFDLTRDEPCVTYLGLMHLTDNTLYLTFDLFGPIGGLGTQIFKYDFTGEDTYMYRIAEKIDEQYPFIGEPLCIHDGWLVSLESPETIEYLKERYNIDKGIEIAEDDNPMVCFHHLKN